MSLAHWLCIAFSFLAAGSVKGITGMGLPTVAMGLLGLQMTPAQAAALIVLPSLATNLWQYLSGTHRRPLLRRLWPMLLAMSLTSAGCAGLMLGDDTHSVTVALGVVLLAYAMLGLARTPIAIPPRYETWLSPAVGLATGIVTGATGVFVIPAVPYLQALGLEKDELVQALGLSFSVSSLALAAGLASYGALRVTAAGASLACIVPAVAGMLAGRMLRARISQPTFRRAFFVALIVLGAALLAR